MAYVIFALIINKKIMQLIRNILLLRVMTITRAARKGINNTPGPGQIENLETLLQRSSTSLGSFRQTV